MRYAVAAAIAACAYAGLMARADACTCMPPPPAADALESAEAVFVGEVESITDLGSESRGGSALVDLAVSRWFKGNGDDRAEVRTLKATSMCGYPFEEGDAYLVYASDAGDGNLGVSLCSRTRPLDQAGDDVRELEKLAGETSEGAGDDPQPGDDPTGDDQTGDDPHGERASGDDEPTEPPADPGQGAGRGGGCAGCAATASAPGGSALAALAAFALALVFRVRRPASRAR